MWKVHKTCPYKEDLIMEKNKNVNIEAITEEYRKAGGSEAVIRFATNNRDLLLKLSDDNFKNEPSKKTNEE